MLTSSPARRLRERLRAPALLVAPGVFDGLSARIAAAAGFEALYASGGAIARSAGVPDLGLLGAVEVLARVREIVEATDLPVIADADAGYGNALNVYRTVVEFERAGVAALHEELRVIAREVRAPLLVNIFQGGRTPLVAPEALEAMGYRVMIVPSDLQRAAMRAMQEAAAAIRATGTAAGLGERLAGFDERDALVDLPAWQRRERRYASGGDPPPRPATEGETAGDESAGDETA